jgi:hypothetical protein
LFLFTEFVRRFIVLFCHLCARRNSNNFHHLIGWRWTSSTHHVS